MGERSAGGGSSGEFPISPLLERSTIDADGHLEVGVSVAGSDPIDEPELHFDVFLRRSRIDPGERIELGIFVSGADEIDETELNVFYDRDVEDLLDLENPGTVRRKTGGVVDDTGDGGRVGNESGDRNRDRDRDDDRNRNRNENRDHTVHSDHTDRAEPASELGATGSGGTTAPTDADYVHPATVREGDDGEYALQRKPLGGTETGDPGYILEISTRATAPPGEYPLPIVFTYRSEDGIKQVKKRRTVRVKTRRERWEPWVTRFAIAVVALAGLGAVLLLGSPL